MSAVEAEQAVGAKRWPGNPLRQKSKRALRNFAHAELSCLGKRSGHS